MIHANNCINRSSFVFDFDNMNDNFDILKEEEKALVITNLSSLLGQEEDLIRQLYPIWNSIALASILKLSRNRIRYSALQNYILKNTLPKNDLELFIHSQGNKFSSESICNYGESLMGILIPDKKSALANAMSNDLHCRSSLILKGLSVVYALYGQFLTIDGTELLDDWKSFVEYFGDFKNNLFDSTVPHRVQKSISEILLLSEIYKESTLLGISEDNDLLLTPLVKKENIFVRSKWAIVAVLSILVLSGLTYFMVNKNADVEIVNSDIDEVIPIDSLNRLNDSLTKAVLDSTQLKKDSLITLTWPKGKEFQIPSSSTLVDIHSYLSDSTKLEGIKLPCFEISFDDNTDQIVSRNEYIFKRLAEGLNRYNKVNLIIYTFSDNGAESALKRGFYLKNRLVGEGVSPKRLEVKTGKSGVEKDNSKASKDQIILEFKK